MRLSSSSSGMEGNLSILSARYVPSSRIRLYTDICSGCNAVTMSNVLLSDFSVCPGIADIRSTLILLKPATLASLKLSINCSNVCIRPSIFNSLLSADCKPKLNLLTPAFLYSESLLSLTVPGLHSIVISASSEILKHSLTADNMSAIQPSGSTDGVPPPKNMDVILSFTCPSAVFLISLISALV